MQVRRQQRVLKVKNQSKVSLLLIKSRQRKRTKRWDHLSMTQMELKAQMIVWVDQVSQVRIKRIMNIHFWKGNWEELFLSIKRHIFRKKITNLLAWNLVKNLRWQSQWKRDLGLIGIQNQRWEKKMSRRSHFWFHMHLMHFWLLNPSNQPWPIVFNLTMQILAISMIKNCPGKKVFTLKDPSPSQNTNQRRKYM